MSWMGSGQLPRRGGTAPGSAQLHENIRGAAVDGVFAQTGGEGFVGEPGHGLFRVPGNFPGLGGALIQLRQGFLGLGDLFLLKGQFLGVALTQFRLHVRKGLFPVFLSGGNFRVQLIPLRPEFRQRLFPIFRQTTIRVLSDGLPQAVDAGQHLSQPRPGGGVLPGGGYRVVGPVHGADHRLAAVGLGDRMP